MAWSSMRCVTAATGTAEREAALLMLRRAARGGRITVGGDKNFDTRDFVRDRASWALRRTSRRNQPAPAAPSTARTTRHPGYAISQQKRKLVEQVFGWMKTVGGLRKLRHRGGPLVEWIVTFAAATYNLVRLRRLLAQPV